MVPDAARVCAVPIHQSRDTWLPAVLVVKIPSLVPSGSPGCEDGSPCFLVGAATNTSTRFVRVHSGNGGALSFSIRVRPLAPAVVHCCSIMRSALGAVEPSSTRTLVDQAQPTRGDEQPTSTRTQCSVVRVRTTSVSQLSAHDPESASAAKTIRQRAWEC